MPLPMPICFASQSEDLFLALHLFPTLFSVLFHHLVISKNVYKYIHMNGVVTGQPGYSTSLNSSISRLHVVRGIRIGQVQTSNRFFVFVSPLFYLKTIMFIVKQYAQYHFGC